MMCFPQIFTGRRTLPNIRQGDSCPGHGPRVKPSDVGHLSL